LLLISPSLCHFPNYPPFDSALVHRAAMLLLSGKALAV
jgi:hypothetical protein